MPGGSVSNIQLYTSTGSVDRLLERIPDIRQDGDVQRLQSNFINGTKHLPVAFAPTAPLGGKPLPARAG